MLRDQRGSADGSAKRTWFGWAGAGLIACASLAPTAFSQGVYGPQRPAPSHYAPPVAAAAPLAPVTLRADQIGLLQRTLAQADAQGFEPGDFEVPEVRGGATDQLVAEILRYAQAVHAGRLAPADFLHEWGLRPAAYDPGADFAQAVASDRLGPWLDSLPPPYTGYDSLRVALSVYRAIESRGGWRPIPGGVPLVVGVSDPRVSLLRARLAVEDPAVVADGGPVFDAALAEAVIRAQKRYGLEPDGVIRASTLAALNVPVESRVGQIEANMERWRWLPQALPADRIQVNIAAAVLILFRSDAPLLSMKAVTGRPGDETPMLQSQISSIVFNPPWNVPASIASKELWPKERAHPGYLARNDFVVVPTGDGGVRLVQQAGDKAALGHVKFDFANPYGVYLHDTPSHGGFSKYTRQESHGCVRLERPVVLAKAVMDGSPQWQPDIIDQTIASGDTVRAQMPRQLAVFLLYWTAFVGADGQANFRADPYNWDQQLMQRIAAASHRSA